MAKKSFRQKEKEGYRICSKCYEGLNWQGKDICPNCGNNKILPYRDIRGKKLGGSNKWTNTLL